VYALSQAGLLRQPLTVEQIHSPSPVHKKDAINASPSSCHSYPMGVQPCEDIGMEIRADIFGDSEQACTSSSPLISRHRKRLSAPLFAKPRRALTARCDRLHRFLP
jgi:hypothetical protein